MTPDEMTPEDAYDATSGPYNALLTYMLNRLDALDGVAPLALTSLAPASAVIGDPSFTLHVLGTGFSQGSVIVFGGQDEPTTFVSSTELTTGVDMTVWLGPDPAIPVLVRRGIEETNTLTFAMEAAAQQQAAVEATKHGPPKESR